MSTGENLTVLHRAIDSWNRQDYEGYLDLYAETAVLSGYAGVEPGKAGIRTFYQGISAAFPGSRIDLDDVFPFADKVVCRYRLNGTHAGPFQGMPATGRSFVMPGITILRFANGQCVERWSQADFLGLMMQLGALPAPSA